MMKSLNITCVGEDAVPLMTTSAVMRTDDVEVKLKQKPTSGINVTRMQAIISVTFRRR
jgi:hypothetical protein